MPQELKAAEADVMLLVFSGRQNPSWALSEADTTSVLNIIRQLSPSTERMPQGDLGYQGFEVSFKDTASLPIGAVRVYNGAVEYVSGDIRETFADPARHLERLLFERSKDVVPMQVYETARSQAHLP